MTTRVRPRVLHLVGSAVSEFYGDLSRLYAADCLEHAADPGRYDSVVAYVTPDGRWRFPVDLSRDAIDAASSLSLSDAVARIATTAIDVMVPQMFCLPGMTYYRGLFDLLDIPYVGNTPDVMAVAADKARAKALVAASGVRVPHGEILRCGDRPTLAPPAVVKPLDADNSLGLALVRDEGDYPAALDAALSHSDRILVERYVELGREVRCGIVVQDGRPVGLPLEEYDVDRDRKPIRDHDDKIARGGDGDLTLVAKDASRAWIVDRDDPATARVWEAALRCHEALGCRDYSLFDFRIDPDGEPWFLEAGLYCSYSRQSVIPMMAAAAGITVSSLFDDGIQQALRWRS